MRLTQLLDQMALAFEELESSATEDEVAAEQAVAKTTNVVADSLPHARAALEVWRHDYNDERPHSKLGWMTPRGYASVLGGEDGRDAALCWGSAPRPLATHQQKGSDQPRTLVSAG